MTKYWVVIWLKIAAKVLSSSTDRSSTVFWSINGMVGRFVQKLKQGLWSRQRICVSLVTPNNDVNLEIQSRIQTANRCICANSCSWGIFHLQQNSSSTRSWFILDRHGVLVKSEENQLLVFERKVLRAMCDPKLENGEYRKKNNFEL
jgi:hypothetical protein